MRSADSLSIGDFEFTEVSAACKLSGVPGAIAPRILKYAERQYTFSSFRSKR